MKCPYCGNEMEIGVVQSAREFFWSYKKNKMFYVANESNGDIQIAKWGLTGCAKEAQLCKSCRKIIMDI